MTTLRSGPDAAEAGERSGLFRRLDSPRLVLILTAIAYLLVIAAVLRQHGCDASYFVQAGDRFSDPNAVPENLLVLPNSDGYDGQFYYRLALDPFTNKQSDFGVTIDAPSYRHQRIVYPFLVWLPTRGNPGLVPMVMILVNYLALCTMAYVGARFARAMGEHALWGLAFPLYPGFVLVLMRDLAEILAVCFLLTSLLLIRHGRHAPATLLLTLAVLTRESTLLVAVAALLVRLVGAWNGTTGDMPKWHFGLVPIGVCALWQALLWSHWGSVPFLSGSGPRSLPFVALAGFFVQTAALDTNARRVWFLELCFLGLFAMAVAAALPRSRATGHEKVSWLLYLGLASVLGSDVWSTDWSFKRVLAELYGPGAIILIGSRFVGRVPVFIGSTGLWLLLAGSFMSGYR